MKVGIYNIYIGFLYFFMLLLTSYLVYFSIESIIVKKLEWSNFFSLIFGLSSVPLWGYFFYKFQVIIVTNKNLVELKPFLFLVKIIKLDSIEFTSFSSWVSSKGHRFIYTKIIDSNGKSIIISQAMFENFESIIKSFYLYRRKNLPKKIYDLYLLEAKENKLDIIINLFLLIPFLIFIIGTTFSDKVPFSSFHKIVVVINVILLFATLRRYRSYNLRLKNSK